MSWKKELEKIARAKLTDSTHSFDHASCVSLLCERIGKAEGADLEALFAASFLHDITYTRDHSHHEKSGAEEAEKILVQTSFPKSKIPSVLSAIRKHRFSKVHRAESLEEHILQDADKLDAIGAWGIARCFMWTGERKLPMCVALEHFPEKLLKLKELMNTRTAKKIAAKRHLQMLRFLRELEEI